MTKVFVLLPVQACGALLDRPSHISDTEPTQALSVSENPVLVG